MANDPHPTYLLLKEFLEQREVCARASSPLKQQASVRILFSDHEEIYTFVRHSFGPRLEPGAPHDPDFTLRLPTGMVRALHELESEDIGEFGALVVGTGLSQDPEYHLGGAIHAGFGRLWAHGYFGILRMGGWQVARVLAAKGLANIRSLRKKINENVNPVD